MEYLLTIKDGTEVLDQELSDSKSAKKLVKQVLMAMSSIKETEARIQTRNFLDNVDKIGAQSISNSNTGYRLVVQKHKE